MRTITLCLLLSSTAGLGAQDAPALPSPVTGRPVPRIDGQWWTIAHNPDLGRLTGPEQQPVDFAIWQARDGTWQLWSCIRHTKADGHTRVFHRWEGRRLTDTDWRPLGIAMQADPALGEAAGGLQAPHVLRDGDVFRMVYGDWNRICLAESRDGKKFERVLNARGEPGLFAGPYGNTRDPMLLKIGALYHCYYTGGTGNRDGGGATFDAAVFCRTSHDLHRWSEPVIVSAGGTAAKVGGPGTNAECPFVVAVDDGYCLFRNVAYGQFERNVQYASKNPLCFGVGDDLDYSGHLAVAAPEIVQFKGRYYIAALLPTLDGIRIARLEWGKS
ncbi:MAG: hypothetical protein KDC98_01480 [Planctomycetes bacterium]|nr:hypothetical protein [Planctomycetota bacterium]